MKDMKGWVIQLRYPYTAGVISVMWIGGAILAITRPELPVPLLVSMVAVATIIIATVGFSGSSR